RRRRRIRAAGSPPRVRRVPRGARAALLDVDRHGRALAGRPSPRPRAPGSASPASRLGRHAAHLPAMTFRSRILVGFGVVVLVPLVLFGVRVRTEMASRLTEEDQQRVAALAAVIRADRTRDGAAIARRLDALTEAIAADNRFRAALLQGGDRTYLLDYAGRAMRFAGLSMLQIQDDQGRIVSGTLPQRIRPARAGATACARGRTGWDRPDPGAHPRRAHARDRPPRLAASGRQTVHAGRRDRARLRLPRGPDAGLRGLCRRPAADRYGSRSRVPGRGAERSVPALRVGE